jgi:hypothetical protein
VDTDQPQARRLVENPRWSTWRLAGVAAEPVEPRAAPISAVRLAELSTMSYRDYLRTPEWRRTRAAAIERAGGHCSLDHAHTGPLQVHHATYERRGLERPGDLTVLCEACHRLHHAEHGRPGPRPRRTGSIAPPSRASADVMPVAEQPARGWVRRLLGV